MLRLFVAVDLPEPLRAALTSAFDGLPEAARGEARPVRTELLHLTLKFLGNVEDERAGEIAAATIAAARAAHPADVVRARFAAFPRDTRAHVLAASLEEPAGALAALAGDLNQRFESFGIAADTRAFHPHVTLARFRSPANVRAVCDREIRIEPARLNRVTLYRSHLGPDGPTYEALASEQVV